MKENNSKFSLVILSEVLIPLKLLKSVMIAVRVIVIRFRNNNYAALSHKNNGYSFGGQLIGLFD